MQKYGELEYYSFGQYDTPLVGDDAIRNEALSIARDIENEKGSIIDVKEIMLISHIISLTSRYAVRRDSEELSECMRGYHLMDDLSKSKELRHVFMRFAGYVESHKVEKLDLPLVHFLRSRHLRRPVVVLERLADDRYLMNRPFRYLLDWERDAKKQQEIFDEMIIERHGRKSTGMGLRQFKTMNGEAFINNQGVEIMDDEGEEKGLKKTEIVVSDSMMIEPSIEVVKGEEKYKYTGVYGAYYGSLLRWSEEESIMTLKDNKQMVRVIVTSGSMVVGRLLMDLDREGLSRGLVPMKDLRQLFNNKIIVCPAPVRGVLQMNAVIPFSQHEETRIRNHWSRLKLKNRKMYWLARKEHKGRSMIHLLSSFDPVTVEIEAEWDIKRDSEYGGDGSVSVLDVRLTSNIYEETKEFFIRKEFGDNLEILEEMIKYEFVSLLDQPFGEGTVNEIQRKMDSILELKKYNMTRPELMMALTAELFQYFLFELGQPWRLPWNVWVFILEVTRNTSLYFDFLDLASKFLSTFLKDEGFHYDSMYNDILIHVNGQKREYMTLYSTFNMLESKLKGKSATGYNGEIGGNKRLSNFILSKFSHFHQMIWKIIGEFSVNADPSIPLDQMVNTFTNEVAFAYAGYMYIRYMKKITKGVAYERGSRRVVQYIEKMSGPSF